MKKITGIIITTLLLIPISVSAQETQASFFESLFRKHKINVSVRRLDKEGRMNLTVKYVFGELYMLTKGPFKHRMPFRYEFANFQKKDAKDETVRKSS